MSKQQWNGWARWVIVGLAVAGLVFNSGILYNDVKHLAVDAEKAAERNDIAHDELKDQIRELRDHILQLKGVSP